MSVRQGEKVHSPNSEECAMYAVIATGGKQYKVKEGDVVRVEKLPGNPGDQIEFDTVLLVGQGSALTVGNPFVESARVTASILGHGRAKKVVVAKFKRRKAYRKKAGHRQHYTGVKILSIKA
jgi:large subunit ribosomal protein L21